MRILVTGASGFVGSQVVTDLQAAGHQVICCVRNVEFTQKLFPTATIYSCNFIEDKQISDWLPRLENVDVVINTVGIFYHPSKKIIWSTHYDVPKALFDACKEKQIKKIIHISALNVEQYDVDYAKSKNAIDLYLKNSGLPVFILRPSLIHGKGSYGGTSLFRGLSALPFLIPLPGKGEQEFQPIYVNDLARSIVKLIDVDISSPQILSAVSRDRVQLKLILKTLRTWLGLPHAFFLPVPLFLLKAGSLFGNFIPNSTMNNTAIKMLVQNNIATEDATNDFEKIIQFKPANFVEATFSHPSNVQDRWHAKLYFVKPLLQLSLAFLWIVSGIVSAFVYPKEISFDLLSKVGVANGLQPIFLYGASTLDFLIGFGLLLNLKVRVNCILQASIILFYTLIITFFLPETWIEPFGPITKNIPILVAIYILYILEADR